MPLNLVDGAPGEQSMLPNIEIRAIHRFSQGTQEGIQVLRFIQFMPYLHRQ